MYIGWMVPVLYHKETGHTQGPPELPRYIAVLGSMDMYIGIGMYMGQKVQA